MSLFETGHSTAAISLGGLLQGEPAATADPGLSVNDLIERVAVGGWPGREGFTVSESLRANLRIDNYACSGHRG